MQEESVSPKRTRRRESELHETPTEPLLGGRFGRSRFPGRSGHRGVQGEGE